MLHCSIFYEVAYDVREMELMLQVNGLVSFQTMLPDVISILSIVWSYFRFPARAVLINV